MCVRKLIAIYFNDKVNDFKFGNEKTQTKERSSL